MSKIQDEVNSICLYDTYDRIFDLTISQNNSLEEIEETERLKLLFSLCMYEKNWLNTIEIPDSVFISYEGSFDDLKDDFIRTMLGYLVKNSIHPHPYSGRNSAAETLIFLLELHFSERVDKWYKAVEEVPNVLNEIFKRNY